MIKSTKEFKLKNYKNFKVKYGCVNHKDLKSVYIIMSSWAEPLDDYDFKKIINLTKKNLKQLIYNHISHNTTYNIDKDKTILDFDIRESGVRLGKKSFLNCEVTLFFKNKRVKIDTILKNQIISIIDLMVSNVFNRNEYFKFHKDKKMVII